MQRTNRQLHLRADGLLLDRSWRAEQIRLPQRGKSGEDEYEVNEDAWRARGHELRAVLQAFDDLSSGVCYYRAEENGQPQVGIGNDPMHNESVKAYIRSGCREAGCTLGECKVLGRHSRLRPKNLVGSG